MEEVEVAAKAANASDFITAMPQAGLRKGSQAFSDFMTSMPKLTLSILVTI